MQALMHIDQLKQARVLLSPIRVEILDMLRERGTCTEMARRLQTSPQRTNNHVKELLRAGFVEIVEKRPKRNMIETVYQARAKTPARCRLRPLVWTPRCRSTRALKSGAAG